MRLPTANKNQQEYEDAREMHELLWLTYQQGGRVAQPITPAEFASRRCYRYGMGAIGFWRNRGYKICSKTTPDRRYLEIWLVKREASRERISAPVDYTTCQPASWVA